MSNATDEQSEVGEAGANPPDYSQPPPTNLAVADANVSIKPDAAELDAIAGKAKRTDFELASDINELLEKEEKVVPENLQRELKARLNTGTGYDRALLSQLRRLAEYACCPADLAGRISLRLDSIPSEDDRVARAERYRMAVGIVIAAAGVIIFGATAYWVAYHHYKPEWEHGLVAASCAGFAFALIRVMEKFTTPFATLVRLEESRASAKREEVPSKVIGNLSEMIESLSKAVSTVSSAAASLVAMVKKP